MKTMNFRKGTLAALLAVGGVLNMPVAYADWTYKFREHEYITVKGALAATGLSKLDSSRILAHGLDAGMEGGLSNPVKEGIQTAITIYDKAAKYDLVPDNRLNEALPWSTGEMAEVAKIFTVKSTNPNAKTININGDPYKEPEPGSIEKAFDAIVGGLRKAAEFTGDVADIGISVLSFAESLTTKQVTKGIPIIKNLGISDLAETIKTGTDLSLFFHDQQNETQEFYAYAINEIAYTQLGIVEKISGVINSNLSEKEKARKIFDFTRMLDILMDDLVTHKENLNSNYINGVTIHPRFKQEIISVIDSNIEFITRFSRECGNCGGHAVSTIISSFLAETLHLDDEEAELALTDFIEKSADKINMSELRNYWELEELIKNMAQQYQEIEEERKFWDSQIDAFYDVLGEYGPAHASEELGLWTDQYRDDLFEHRRTFDEQTARAEISRMIDNWKTDTAKTLRNRINMGEWTGGMIGVSRDGTAWWRTRASDRVTATPSKSGKTLTFTLSHTDKAQPTRFKIDPTATTRIADRDVYRGEIDFLDFSRMPGDDTSFRIFLTNGAQDFFKFEWAWLNEGVLGYYGERITSQSQLPKSGVSTFKLVHDRVNTESTKQSYLMSYGASMKLFVAWQTGKVYGIDTNHSIYSSGLLGKGVYSMGGGPVLYVGDLDQNDFSIKGRYVYKPNFENIRHTSGAGSSTSLQLYGKDRPNGIGGAFTTLVHDKKGSSRQEAAQISGFLDGLSGARKPDATEHWYGFASGLFVDRKTGKVDAAYNINSNYVYMGFRPNENNMWASIYVGKDDSGDLDYHFSNASENSTYIDKDAFVALEDVDGVPSYVATTMDGDKKYHYLSWGVWNAEQVNAPDIAMANGSHWIAGKLTETSSMPKTGSAKYDGQVYGAAHEGNMIQMLTGTVDLTATFGNNGKVSGNMRMHYANSTTPYATVTLQPNVAITGNHFKGDLGGDIKSGGINGAFYGPGAVEIGGNWHVKKDDKSQAVGVFAGKKTGGK